MTNILSCGTRHYNKSSGPQVKEDADTPTEVAEEMAPIKEAYGVLTDSKARREYDEIGYSGAPLPLLL